MRKILFREPIHLNISNKGKLRRIEHHKVELPNTQQNLLLTPANILTHTPESKKQKYHFYLKKQEATKDKEIFKHQDHQFQPPQETGSFRAIHTANTYDSIRGFPLRSITPIKPFRRGIRSTSKPQSKTIEISQLRQEKLTNRSLRQNGSPPSLKLRFQDAFTYQSPEHVFKYVENEGYQEFYKYEPKNETAKKPDQESGGRVAGTKIEPFKKYKIREMGKGWISQRKWAAESPNNLEDSTV